MNIRFVRSGIFAAAAFLALTGCAPKQTKVVSSVSALSIAGCESLPPRAVIASPCTGASGTWTAYDVTIADDASSSATMTCNGSENEHDQSQADFDAREVNVSLPAGEYRTSNHDFSVSTICASGSYGRDDSGTVTRRLLIWEKQP